MNVVSTPGRTDGAATQKIIRLHRVLRASPENVFKAFTDADAMARWLPPRGYTAKVHAMEARKGGSYRMSFTEFASGHGHSFGGEYLDFEPGKLLRYTAKFEDANLPGEMQTTIKLTKVGVGTELDIVQEGIPDIIPLDACHLGWQDSLMFLGLLVEGENAR